MLGAVMGVEGLPNGVTVCGIAIMLAATALVGFSAPSEEVEGIAEPLLPNHEHQSSTQRIDSDVLALK